MGGKGGTYLRGVFVCSMLLILLTACSTTPPNSFVLMPDPDGNVGAIVITNKGGSQVLSKPFQQTETTNPNTAPSQPIVLTEDKIREIFGDALAAQPESPIRYLLYFHNASNKMTDDSLRLMPQILTAIQTRKSTWIGVVGHTDRVGSRLDNFKLSLSRAEAVRDTLISKGVASGSIQIGSHGEDNALVWTDDEVPEPRNRRVEVTIR
jgi:outer membrane protein OmpA-like peptidoglycan-associated protein